MEMLTRTSLFLLLLVSISACNQKTNKASEGVLLPNVIYILADDLGYGDPGCYGQEKFETPNIDQMAKQGMRFTRHYAGSTVCAPSRSVLMTGLHTGHTPIRGNREVRPEGQAALPGTAYTIAEMLKDAAYVTGAFGKWGLGFPGSEGDPLNQGFDRFFGYNCQRYAHRYYPEYLWDDDQKYKLEGNDWTTTTSYAPDVIQERTLEFIRANKDTSFFAFVPMVIPHAELIVPEDEIFEFHKGRYPEEPYVGRPGADYGPDMIIGRYCSQELPHATFASMVQRLDAHVGEILNTLEELGISENTIVLFTSDNGPHKEGGADPDFFNSSGGLRGVKRDLYEGGIRVPFIVSWPGTIPGGQETDHISAFWDLLPTLAEITGCETPASDGISFLPTLLGEEQNKHAHLYWEFHERGGKQAILKDEWKAIRLNVGKDPAGPLELYNLKEDPYERNNVAGDYPEIRQTLSDLMEEERVPSASFNFGMSTYSGE